MRLSQRPDVVPACEEDRDRIVALHRYDLLDPTPSPELDALTRLGANLFEVQLCRVTVVGPHEVTCRSAGGPLATSAQWPREGALCSLALGREMAFIPTLSLMAEARVGGTVTSMAFYAAAVLRDPGGVPIGTFHVADEKAQTLSAQRRDALMDLARMCEAELFSAPAPVTVIPSYGWMRDPTTGCVSTYQLNEELQKVAITRMPRIARLNLENLHQVETRHGHEGVARVLSVTAARLTETLGPDTMIARTRWDAFVFIVPPHWQDEDEKVADQLAFLAQHLTRIIDLGTSRFSPRVTLGASFPAEPHPDPERTMLEVNRITKEGRADNEAIVVQTAKKVAERRRHGELLQRLEQAIQSRLLSVVVQPKFDMSLRPVGGEVLARWIDPELGFISPDDFIPLAEDNGLIVRMGWTIVERACASLGRAKAAGIVVPPLAVNVSTSQLASFGFAGDLLETLAAFGLTPEDVNVEVTESVFSRNMSQARAILERLAEAGMSIYLDDYGTGYSSLAYLKALPLTHIKLDRTFIMALERDRDDAAIVEATIAMAHALGMKVVAEGIENQAQWRLLREMGCDAIQGYWCGRPMPFDAYVDVVRAERAACATQLDD